MMLPEPEHTIVKSWIDAGGVIRVVPFGVGGKLWRFVDTARRSGTWGAFKRFGGRHIDRAAFVHIARGELTVARARVAVVWTVLQARGLSSQGELCAALELDHNALHKVLVELTALGAVARVVEGRICKLRAAGDRAPHWTDFLRDEQRAA